MYPDQVPYEACPRCGKVSYKELGRIIEGGLEVQCYECGEVYLIFGLELRENLDDENDEEW